jgi:hypothetical protein
VFIDTCGMTQSIVFILCSSEDEAKLYSRVLEHPLYVFINNICRWGNFNNIRILQSFPIPPDVAVGGGGGGGGDVREKIYECFNITKDEIAYIENNL